jgi:flagellar motor protein MotB
MIRPLLPLVLALGACAPATSSLGLETQLEREILALRGTVSSLERSLELCGEDGTSDSLYAELNQVFTKSEITLDRVGLTTLVTVPADHLFSRGTDLRDEAGMTLDFLATALGLHPGYRIFVEAHTDDLALTGDLRHLYRDNWGLSFARAEAVKDAMVERYGVTESRFTLVARGAHQPLTTNDTPAGRSRNRRVVFHLKPRRATDY